MTVCRFVGKNAGRREQRWQMAEQPMIARQLPDRGESFIDQLAHVVPSLDCAASVLEKLGVRLTHFAAQRNRTPNGNEPSGMANRCVMLREGYLEFLTAVSQSELARQIGRAHV